MRDSQSGTAKKGLMGSLRSLTKQLRGGKGKNEVSKSQENTAEGISRSNSDMVAANAPASAQGGSAQQTAQPIAAPSSNQNTAVQQQKPAQQTQAPAQQQAAAKPKAAPVPVANDMDDDADVATTLGNGPSNADTQAKKLVVHPTGRFGAGQRGGQPETAPPPSANQSGSQTRADPTSSTASAKGSKQAQTGRLVYTTSYGTKMSYPLLKEETTIGRKEDNQIVLTDPKISKCHASVARTARGYTILDRNSSNGVKVNNEFIPPGVPRPLVNGDEVMIGAIKLTFYDHPDPSAEQGGGATVSAAGGTSSISNQGGSVNGASSVDERILKLVTILPSDNQFDKQIAIKAELEAEAETDFRRADEVESIAVLKEDYEKLRLAYQLSKITLTNDITPHLEKSLELMFEIVPVDRGVVLLVDQNTGTLAAHFVKLREGAEEEGKEILLSSTILKKVYESRKCLITTDASQDSTLRAAASVMSGQIRSVICVPLMAHNKVHGILHLDSADRITKFSSKDLALVQAISNQTAIAIENSVLMSEFEANARLNEQLSRFLAPHVVQKMSDRSAIIRRGGRLLVGTIIFVDIRGFTNLSEKSEPVEVVHLLNDYFERLVRIVFKYNGVVDKYIGDALMAVFGTLEDDQDAEFRAVAAALEFQDAIKEMNDDRARVGKDPVCIGVGVNTGELIAGFIGSSQRLEYTCIGDSVNTSSRVCSMAKKDQVLISEFTHKYVSDRVKAVSVGYRQFKGKQKEVQVYQVFGTKEPGEEWVPPPSALATAAATAAASATSATTSVGSPGISTPMASTPAATTAPPLAVDVPSAQDQSSASESSNLMQPSVESYLAVGRRSISLRQTSELAKQETQSDLLSNIKSDPNIDAQANAAGSDNTGENAAA